jgi:hypothetical protein
MFTLGSTREIYHVVSRPNEVNQILSKYPIDLYLAFSSYRPTPSALSIAITLLFFTDLQ